METKKIPTITVFTPAYNRADLLGRCYESLLRQSSKDFVWLIVDDGSTDNTKDVVDVWMTNENGFDIQYIYKENGGLHTGYNTAIEHAETELCVCIDSDDFMPDQAIEHIVKFWNDNKSDQVAGIVGLDYDLHGNCLGDSLPEMDKIDLIALTTGRYSIHNADRKLVVRTDLYKEAAPMPSYPGEKFFNPQYMHMKIALKYPFLVMNECLCIVEYQPCGMSNIMYHQYYSSPNSFADIRIQDLSLPGTGTAFKLKKSIHYCSSCILAKRRGFIQKSPHPLMAAVCILPGWMLSIWIRWKNR